MKGTCENCQRESDSLAPVTVQDDEVLWCPACRAYELGEGLGTECPVRIVIEVDGGIVQDVSLEVKTGSFLVVPEVIVNDRDVEGRERDEVRVDAHGEYLPIPMAVHINVTD